MLKLQHVIIFSFIFFCGYANARIADANLKTIDHSGTEYRSRQSPHSTKHKFGYELAENKHFHHTTTDEDGVRLGCYGHILEGVKYSTQYVADMKGYRMVPTHDLITVYPRSGGERKASFIREFNEAANLSRNIRFFFPDACKAEARITTTPRSTTLRTTTFRTTTPKREKKCYCTCE